MEKLEIIEFQTTKEYSCKLEGDETDDSCYSISLINSSMEAIALIKLYVSFGTKNYWEKLKLSKIAVAELEVALREEKTHVETFKESLLQKEKEFQALAYKKSESLGLQFQKLQQENQDLLLEKQNLEEMISRERNYIKNLETKITEATSEYNQYLFKSQERDLNFMQKLADYIKENSELHQLNQESKFHLEEKNNHILFLEEKLKSLTHFQPITAQNSEFLHNNSNESFQLKSSTEEFYSEIIKSQVRLEDMYASCLKNQEKDQNELLTYKNCFKQENEKITKENKILNDQVANYETQISKLLFEKELLSKELSNTYQNLTRESESKKNHENNQILESILHETFNDLKPIDNSKFSNKSVQYCDNSDSDLIKNLNSSINELQGKLKTLEEDYQINQLELSQYKCKLLHKIKLERISIDEIDLLLEQFCNDYNLNNLFIKVFSGVYVYMSKQISLTIKNGKLICRHGGITMEIDEFLKNEFQNKKSQNSSISNQSNLINSKSEKLANQTTSPKIHKHTVNENEFQKNEEKLKITFKEKIYSPVRKHFRRKN